MRRFTASVSSVLTLTQPPQRVEGVRMYWYGAKLNRSAFVNGRSSAAVGVLSGGLEMVKLPRRMPGMTPLPVRVSNRPLAEALLQPLPPMLQVVWPGFGNCEIERSRENTG